MSQHRGEIGDARQDAGVVELSGPLPFEPIPPEDIKALAAIRRREQLLRSPQWQRLAPGLQRVTYALLHQPAPAPPPPASSGFVRVATWNIERGIELDGIKAYLAAHPELSQADILMLNEVDLGMARSGNRDVAAEIAQTLGFNLVFGNSYLCLGAGDTRDGLHAREPNRESMHGNAVLSRHPITRAENISITLSADKYHSSDRRLGHKKALWAQVQTPLGPLPVLSAHLDVYGSFARRRAQLLDILEKVKQRGLRERVLLGGDLNSCTYDVQNLPHLAWNLLLKLCRGGFPHGIYHYMHPYELYERPVYDALVEHGFEVEPFNAMDQETSRYEVGDFESESKVSDSVPRFVVDLLRWKLQPWGGVAPLKLDWFAGRGLRPCWPDRGEAPEGSLSPRVFHRPEWEGKRLSDHDPLMVDVTW